MSPVAPRSTVRMCSRSWASTHPRGRGRTGSPARAACTHPVTAWTHTPVWGSSGLRRAGLRKGQTRPTSLAASYERSVPCGEPRPRTQGPFHPFESLRQKSKDREFLVLGTKALSPGKSWTHCCADTDQEPQEAAQTTPQAEACRREQDSRGRARGRAGTPGSGPGQAEEPQRLGKFFRDSHLTTMVILG